jgi:hypothetical protein
MWDFLWPKWSISGVVIQLYLGRSYLVKFALPNSFSCFALQDSFWVVLRPSGLIFQFCAPGQLFGGTEGIGSRFHVMRSPTHFLQYRSHRGSISCFTLPNSFRAVQRASGTVFKFCAPGLVFDGTEGVGARFHFLRSRTLFARYRGRRVLFSCFALPNSFRAVPRASGTVFKFCAPRLVFDGTEGDRARFHVLRSRTLFGWYRGRRGSFSSFAFPDTFLTVPRALGPVFKFCSPGLIFDDTEAVRSHFHVLRSRTLFRRYRGRRVTFYFVLSDSFRAVPRASCTVFKFCAPELVFDGIEGVEAYFHVLRIQILSGRYRGRWGSFSSFALPDTFLAVPRASGPVFMFCAR